MWLEAREEEADLSTGTLEAYRVLMNQSHDYLGCAIFCNGILIPPSHLVSALSHAYSNAHTPGLQVHTHIL